MRKTYILIFLIALIGVVATACNDNGGTEPPDPPKPPKVPQEISWYYLGNEKRQLSVRPDLVVVKAASHAEATALCENDIFAFEGLPLVVEEWIIFASIDPAKATIDDVRRLPGVVGAACGLESDTGNLYLPTDEIFVHPGPGKSVESVLQEAGLAEYVTESGPMNPQSEVYLVTLNLNPEYILWASTVLYETGLCEFAEPSFYMRLKQ